MIENMKSKLQGLNNFQIEFRKINLIMGLDNTGKRIFREMTSKQNKLSDMPLWNFEKTVCREKISFFDYPEIALDPKQRFEYGLNLMRPGNNSRYQCFMITHDSHILNGVYLGALLYNKTNDFTIIHCRKNEHNNIEFKNIIINDNGKLIYSDETEIGNNFYVLNNDEISQILKFRLKIKNKDIYDNDEMRKMTHNIVNSEPIGNISFGETRIANAIAEISSELKEASDDLKKTWNELYNKSED